MARILLLMALGALGACATMRDYPPDSPYYRYPGGARFTLNIPLEIEPDSATVRLQFGRVVPRNGVQEEEPHCVFEVSTVRPAPQRVEPDSFAVTRVIRNIRTSSILPSAPYEIVRVDVGSDSSGPTFIYYETEFRLHSPRQPDVRAMTCLSNQNAPGIAPFMRHLSLPEIRQALGLLFTVEISDAGQRL